MSDQNVVKEGWVQKRGEDMSLWWDWTSLCDESVFTFLTLMETLAETHPVPKLVPKLF